MADERLTLTEKLRREQLRRVQEMPLSEIAYRVGERARRGMEREAHVRGRHRADGARLLERIDSPSGRKFASFLRDEAAPRFYLPADEVGRARLAHAFRERFPERQAALVAEADRLASHRVELLGLGELDLAPAGGTIDWHRDPQTGRSWERRFWADYDLVREDVAGDPKVVLELNRHQHLPRLALAAWLAGEERFARAAVAQLLSWIEQNPPGFGVHWHSSLEIALRSLSWLWTLFLLLPSPALEDESLARIAASLFAQLEQVRRYPSLYSSPNTHLLGEAVAIFVAGLLFAGCEPAAAWEARGRELLERELARQVGEDGVHRELSPWYHAYALDFALQAVALARLHERPLAAVAEERVERMVGALADLARPDGTLPRLGDDDGGRALALDRASYDRVDDLLATGAVLFGRGDFKAAAGALPAETLWLLGAAAPARFDALAAVPRAALATHLSESGYVVHRSGADRLDAHLVFDGGGLGGLGGGHGHADALSVTLAAGGRELLVDPGTFVYNGSPRWRDYFRSTRAHNTASVDGLEQATPAGSFAWRRRSRTRAFAPASFGDLELAGAEHDGFAAPEAAGIVHRRRLLYVRPDYWLVADRFLGEGRHRYNVWFHLASDLEASAVESAAGGCDAKVVARAGGEGVALSFHAPAQLAVRLVRGDESGPQGWVSSRYGERRPATVVEVTLEADAPLTLLTTISPLPSQVTTRSLSRRGSTESATASGLAVEIACGPYVDQVLAGTEEEEVATDRMRGRGELLWLRRRRERDGWLRLLAVEARSVGFEGETLLESEAAVSGLLTGAAGAEWVEEIEEEESLHVRHRGNS